MGGYPMPGCPGDGRKTAAEMAIRNGFMGWSFVESSKLKAENQSSKLKGER